MISQILQAKIIEAMKARDSVRTEVLRMLSSSLNYEKIAKQHELSDEEEIAVVRKQVKQRKDSIDAYMKAGSQDRAEKEEAEAKILQEFLPPEMTEEEIKSLVDGAIEETGAKEMKDMGKVIGLVKSKAPNADGSTVAQLVRQRLEAGV